MVGWWLIGGPVTHWWAGGSLVGWWFVRGSLVGWWFIGGSLVGWCDVNILFYYFHCEFYNLNLGGQIKDLVL